MISLALAPYDTMIRVPDSGNPVILNFRQNGGSWPTFNTAIQTRQPRVLVYSDSSGEGHGAGTTKEWQGAWSNLAPNYMTNGRTARSMSWMGWGVGSTFNAAADDRWSLGVGWTSPVEVTFCSSLVLENSANTSSFTPKIVDAGGNPSNAIFDRANVWYGRRNSGNYGSASIADNGGAALATPNSHAVNDAVVGTGSLAISTRADITATTGGAANFRVCGVECWKSSETTAIRICNAATSGAVAAGSANNSATYNLAPQASVQALMGFAPDVLVLALGINDRTVGGESIGPVSLAGSYLNAIDLLASAGNGGLSSVGSVTAGSGFALSQTYSNVPLIYSGAQGPGSGGQATIITSAGGVVAQVNLNLPGKKYLAGDTLTVDQANTGGQGTGFSFTVNVLKFDVLLVMQNPINPAVSSYANQVAYLNALVGYAVANGFPLLNMFPDFGGSYEAAIARGYMTAGDDKHPTLAGYTLYAKNIAAILSVG